MRVLVLTAEARVPDLSAVYQSLPRYLDIDLHVLGKAQQRQLRRYLAGLDLQSYQRILLDLPFKHMVAQATLLARLPGLLIYEEDACQNYLATSKWQGAFSRFYRQLPAARLVVTGASVAQRLRSEGFDALFMAKGYNPHLLFNEQRARDIELGFIGRTASRDYAGRKALLDSLAALEPLQLLRTEPGAEYRHMLNRIRYFVSADVGLGEYMAKNFEAMACGCVLLAWRPAVTRRQGGGRGRGAKLQPGGDVHRPRPGAADLRGLPHRQQPGPQAGEGPAGAGARQS